jgi:hypothetical protein
VLLEIYLGRAASDGKERNSGPGHGAAHCLVVGKFANDQISICWPAALIDQDSLGFGRVAHEHIGRIACGTQLRRNATRDPSVRSDDQRSAVHGHAPVLSAQTTFGLV